MTGWTKMNHVCVTRCTSFRGHHLHAVCYIITVFYLCTCSWWKPVLPSSQRSSHSPTAMTRFACGASMMDGCVCLASTSATRRKRFTTDQQSAWYRKEFIHLVEWKPGSKRGVKGNAPTVYTRNNIHWFNLQQIRLNRYVSYKMVNIKQVVWHGK